MTGACLIHDQSPCRCMDWHVDVTHLAEAWTAVLYECEEGHREVAGPFPESSGRTKCVSCHRRLIPVRSAVIQPVGA